MRFVIVPGIAGSMSGRLRLCDQKRTVYDGSSGRLQPCDRKRT